RRGQEDQLEGRREGDLVPGQISPVYAAAVSRRRAGLIPCSSCYCKLFATRTLWRIDGGDRCWCGRALSRRSRLNRAGAGSVAGRALSQACRDAFPRAVSWPLWVLAEVAICSTDLAEVIGTAIGLNLLFGIPLEIGVLITACDVFLILWLQNIGFRWIEAFIV